MRRSGEDPRYEELAARALREEAVRLSGAPTSLGDRAASLDAIERALRARARRRLRPWIGAAAAVAAVTIVGVVALRPARHEGSVPVAHQERTMPPRDVSHRGRSQAPASLTVAGVDGAEVSMDGATPRRAVTGDVIVAGALLRAPLNGNVVLSSPTGTELGLSSASALRVESLGATQKLRLEAGQVRASVAKLLPGERFLIETPDAEVEVRGTRFEVAIAGAAYCAGGPRTRVSVAEGVVVVRAGGHEARVAAGEIWPSPSCPPGQDSSPVASSRAGVRSADARTQRTTRSHNASRVTVAPSTPDSSLAVQNDLFGAALSAARRGDNREALYWLRRLLERYPDGPLATSARAKERQLVQSTGSHPDGP